MREKKIQQILPLTDDKFRGGDQWQRGIVPVWPRQNDKSHGNHRFSPGIYRSLSCDSVERHPVAIRYRLSCAERLLGCEAEAEKNHCQIREKQSVLPRQLSRPLRFPNADPAFTDIFFTLLNLCFELVGQLQIILQHILQPIAQRCLFRLRQTPDLLLDLFQS